MAKNQTSWRLGESGNPSGAPRRDWTWSGVLQEAVEKAAADGRSVKEVVAASLVREALKGNIRAIKELMNRMDGLPQQNISNTGEPISIVFHESLKSGVE